MSAPAAIRATAHACAPIARARRAGLYRLGAAPVRVALVPPGDQLLRGGSAASSFAAAGDPADPHVPLYVSDPARAGAGRFTFLAARCAALLIERMHP